MALLETPPNTQEQITPAEAKAALRNDLIFGDDPALRLVIGDAQRAENFAIQKSWILSWNSADSLYQSPYVPQYWEGTMVEAASIPFFTVANAVNSLVPQIVNGLFYENPPFIVQERPGTTSQAARASGAILSFQLEDINFREQLRQGAVNAVLKGTAIWKYGYETYTKDRTMYKRKEAPVTVRNPLADAGAADIELTPEEEDIEEVVVTEYVDRPTFENIVSLKHVLVDPKLNVPDIQKAGYVIHRMYPTWEDLDKLRKRPGFNIPSKEKLLELFMPPKEEAEPAANETTYKNPLWDARAEDRFKETSINPFQEPLELLERWDNNSYIVVLQKKLVICNDENPYGKIPFLSCNWWDIPEAFYGLGLAKTIGSEQRLQQGLTNIMLKNAALNLNGVFVRVRGKNVPTQNIRIAPGKIIDVDKPEDFAPLKRLDPIPEGVQYLSLSDARVEKVSGSNDPTAQGLAGSTGHSNLARSAAGANLIAAGGSKGTTDFVERLANNVVVPFLYAAHEMNRALLPISTMRHILSKELQHDYMNDERDGQTGEVVRKGGDMVELLNARVKFSILAAAKMQARRNMAQALPIMVQFLTSPEFTEQLAIQGKKVNIEEVIHMMFAVSDWHNEEDVIVDMTPDDQQRYQQRLQGQQMQKIQGQAALENQKFEQKQQLLDMENTGRAARDVLRHAIETSANPEETTGIPGGVGFGSQA